MATPTSNSVAATIFDITGLGNASGLSAGRKWGGAAGTGVNLTYSFVTSFGLSNHIAGYGSNEFANGIKLNSLQQPSVRAALAVWASVADVKFTEVADNAATVGELRFATTILPAEAYAWGYYPGNYVEAGDVWFSTSWYTDAISGAPTGSYEALTILHEIGHALGLTHSFDTTHNLPVSHDDYFHTIMAYTAKAGITGNYATFFPTTPMYDDLLTIQAVYGRNLSHNASDTIYTFVQGQKYFQTIDDAGGLHDRITYQGTLASVINLNIGGFSSVSDAIGFGNNVSTRATVAIGPNSVIEQAYGGSGNDTLYGNAVANVLSGGNGNDRLFGGGGNDSLAGGAGNDTLIGGFGSDVLTSGTGLDHFVFDRALSASTNLDRITDFSVPSDTIDLENAVFTQLIGLGALSADQFRTGAAALDSSDHIIYNQATGALIYDSNGSAANGATQFATLASGLLVTAADFLIV